MPTGHPEAQSWLLRSTGFLDHLHWLMHSRQPHRKIIALQRPHLAHNMADCLNGPWPQRQFVEMEPCGTAAHLRRAVGELDCLKWRWQQQQLVGVAVLTQDSPHSFEAPPLDEEGVQEEEPLQGQPIIADTLQADGEHSVTVTEVCRLDIGGRVVYHADTL